MAKKMLTKLYRDQRGITGLETAIILIAFVVVASVFAYTVLSAGIFSAEKGKEAIHSGLQTSRSSMELQGGLVAQDTDSDDDIDSLVFTLTNALDGEPVDLATTTDADSDGVLSDETTKSHVTVVAYSDKNQRVDDIAWTVTQMGKGDADTQLDAGEKFQMTVDVSNLSPRLTAYDTFQIEIKPNKGSTLTVERTVPAVVDAVMDLK